MYARFCKLNELTSVQYSVRLEKRLAGGILMSLDPEINCMNQQIGVLDRRESTVRMIGEILPLVIAQYGIGPIDRDPKVLRESEQMPVG
jgi:hypothetical protein